MASHAVDKFAERQIIAANIDYAFIVQAVDRDLNLNRLEQYLTICYSSKVSPVVILSKIDSKESQDLNEKIENIRKRISKVPIFGISNQTKEGVTQ